MHNAAPKSPWCVTPLLASAGYRVIVPYLRGYGTTRFLSNETFRNGQPSAVALDIVALMDALKIQKATLAGFDWGARTANIIAALWPECCKAMVSVSGYLIGSRDAGKMPLPPKAEFEWWYQFYFATERGQKGYDKCRHDFSKLIWQLASPKWNFDDATFDRSAKSFENPDHVAIVIHNYRWRQALAEGEPKYDDLEKGLAASPVITVPTITMEGDANGAPHPDPSVLLASEDSQIGVRMRVCLYGQDRTHRSSSRRSGAACETGERSQHAAEDRVAVADRAFGRRGDWRGRGGEEGGQERAHRAPLAATLRGQGGGGVVEGRDPPGRAQAADSEENQASREPDAQREAVGRHPLERTHDGGTGWHRAVVGT